MGCPHNRFVTEPETRTVFEISEGDLIPAVCLDCGVKFMARYILTPPTHEMNRDGVWERKKKEE